MRDQSVLLLADQRTNERLDFVCLLSYLVFMKHFVALSTGYFCFLCLARRPTTSAFLLSVCLHGTLVWPAATAAAGPTQHTPSALSFQCAAHHPGLSAANVADTVKVLNVLLTEPTGEGKVEVRMVSTLVPLQAWINPLPPPRALPASTARYCT